MKSFREKSCRASNVVKASNNDFSSNFREPTSQATVQHQEEVVDAIVGADMTAEEMNQARDLAKMKGRETYFLTGSFLLEISASMVLRVNSESWQILRISFTSAHQKRKISL